MQDNTYGVECSQGSPHDKKSRVIICSCGEGVGGQQGGVCGGGEAARGCEGGSKGV